MSDLHEARRPEREPQIDTVGWLFLAVAVAITAAAAALVTVLPHELRQLGDIARNPPRRAALEIKYGAPGFSA